MSLKDFFKSKLTKKQLKLVPNSFDIVGSREKAVAIVEIKDGVNKKQIASAIMKLHKNVRTVLEKASPRTGVYRVSRLEIIKGSRNTEVVHKECGFRFKVDPRKAYFSVREAAERERVAKQIKKKETVMVFFAGIGPFAIHAGKKAGKVIGIEINPDAAEYFEENVKMNKLTSITVIPGDVKEKAIPYYGKCDRVIMPLPESSHVFLSDAIKCLKPKGVCHFYCFATEEGLGEKKNLVRKTAKILKKKIKFSGVRKVLPWGPGIYKYRIDFSVL